MPPVNIIIKRILVSLVIGLLIGTAINEITFMFLRETARPPKQIELIIPKGTADRIARGETPPTIPDSMTFVVGDTLIVKNEDTADHELGPLWIPAGSSASLSLDSVQSYAYSCSFQPGKYFGLDVHEALTLSTRLYGILYSGIPMGGLLALYSVIMPFKKKEEK
ncbi:MAG: hypothetical protein K8S20_18055 [Chloroflexi bacterium]|nr:hypothetical protein [Chloroflexota bacterium]